MGEESPEHVFDLGSTFYQALVSHKTEIQAAASVESAVERCRQTRVDSMAVFEGATLVGLWSREHLTSVVGTQFGFALLARKPVAAIMRSDPTVLRNGQPLEPFLVQVMERTGERFQEPVILLSEADQYLGIIPVITLARLQSRMLKARMAQLQTSNECLAIARDVAEAHSRAKSAFLSTISHELLTPMNGILGFLHLLQDTRLDGDQQDFVATACSSSERLLGILTDILTFTQLESSRLTLSRVPCRLDLLIRNTQTSLEAEALAKGLMLRSEFPPEGIPDLLCDRDRLAIVLGHLAGNAVKFSTAGEVIIRIAIAEQDSGMEDLRVRVEVLDQGPGIPPEHLAKLFTPFSQADSSHRRQHGGLGMGLVNSQKLVALMGGKLDCERRNSGGMRFWFSLNLPRARSMGSTDGGNSELQAA